MPLTAPAETYPAILLGTYAARRNFDELALPWPSDYGARKHLHWHRRCTSPSKHENCMVPPCMNLTNPDIRMLHSLTPVAETGGRLGRTKLVIVP
jgi:hypothetical protein